MPDLPQRPGPCRVPLASSDRYLGDRAAWHITRALANSPVALEGFSRCIGALNVGTELDPQVREAIIMRIGALLGSDYEWGRHLPRANGAGLTVEQIRGLRTGNLTSLPEAIYDAVRYIEAVEARTVTDDLWSGVSQRFSTSQIVELTVLGAFYGLVCRFLLALQVELDDDIAGLEMP